MHTSQQGLPASGPASNEGIKQPNQPLLKMFSAVPAHYDFLNLALTWGFDERWRRQAAKECLRDQPGRVLDLCCGTGDLALHLAGYIKGNVQLVGLDFCEPMLELARTKAIARGLEQKVTFVQGDAASLPFPDAYFHAIGISFAFRNITYRNPLRQQYLKEISRVISPGGKFVVVETSQPSMRLLQMAFHLYLRAIVPGVGGFFSGHRGAYRYLADSARRFYNPEEVSQILLEAGFQRVDYRRLLGGMAAIHVAIR